MLTVFFQVKKVLISSLSGMIKDSWKGTVKSFRNLCDRASTVKVNGRVWVIGVFLVVLVVKNLPANAGDIETRVDPWVRKIPWRRAWQPTPVFLPGEPHGQRSLVAYGP